ncbi:MAG: SDR family NAD(P)-dependent oxidoreductase [Roseomonas sp.]|nr:SDR family NAD(P)-dependent oxidoreductase [Roseomonas sp.]
MAGETRVALVTGAQQGIGAAAARALAAAGHDVAINWLDDQTQAEALAAEIRASGRKAALIRGDVGTAAGAAALVELTIAALGRIDVLVNNAGIFPRVEFLEMTEAEWDRVIAVNLKGSAFLRPSGGARHGGGWDQGGDHQPFFLLRPGGAAWGALYRNQGWHYRHDTVHGVIPGGPRDSRECHRAGAHGYRAAALRQ